MGVAKTTEDIFKCEFCNEKFALRMDYLAHWMSSSHVKRMKSTMLQYEFATECMECMSMFPCTKAVEAHLREVGGCRGVHRGGEKEVVHKRHVFTLYHCHPCGLSFRHEVALEVHRTSPPHHVPISASTTPVLHSIIASLCGASTIDRLTLTLTEKHECIICSGKTYESLEAFVLHLFSTSHLESLRESGCLACKNKKFIHFHDRESHISSSKHRSALEKTRQILSSKKGGRIENEMEGAYHCMVCMVWCNSWPCFEMHLIGTMHLKNSSAASRMDCGNHLKPSSSLEEDACHRCDIATMANWQKWKEEECGSKASASGWCHLCGRTFQCPNVIESHLDDHFRGRISPPTSSNCCDDILPLNASEMANSNELHRCNLCSLSFPSALLLTAHEAFLQHHLRIGTHLQKWCQVCGGNLDSPSVLVSSSLMKDKEAEELDIKVVKNKNNNGGETLLASTEISSLQSGSEQREGDVGVERFADCRIETSGALDQAAKEYVCEESPQSSSARNVSANTNIANKQREEDFGMERFTDIRIKTNGTSDQVKNEYVCEEFPQSSLGQNVSVNANITNNESEKADDARIPIVAAAMFAPPGSIHDSLQSAASVLAETLSRALQNFMMPPPTKKRQADGDDCSGKRLCLDKTLQDALRHGFASLPSQGVYLNLATTNDSGSPVVKTDAHHGQDVEAATNNPVVASVSRTEHGIAIMLATAAIPSFSNHRKTSSDPFEADNSACPPSQDQEPKSESDNSSSLFSSGSDASDEDENENGLNGTLFSNDTNDDDDDSDDDDDNDDNDDDISETDSGFKDLHD